MACSAAVRATFNTLSYSPKTSDAIWRETGPWWTKETIDEAIVEMMDEEICVPVSLANDVVGFRLSRARDMRDHREAAMTFLRGRQLADKHE